MGKWLQVGQLFYEWGKKCLTTGLCVNLFYTWFFIQKDPVAFSVLLSDKNKTIIQKFLSDKKSSIFWFQYWKIDTENKTLIFSHPK